MSTTDPKVLELNEAIYRVACAARDLASSAEGTRVQPDDLEELRETLRGWTKASNDLLGAVLQAMGKPAEPVGSLFLAAVTALASYKAVATDEDATGQATIEARDQAVMALRRCADAGAPVLRWMLIALDDIDYLTDIFTRETPNAARICAVEKALRDSEAAPIPGTQQRKPGGAP